jgi:hypothetical protein
VSEIVSKVCSRQRLVIDTKSGFSAVVLRGLVKVGSTGRGLDKNSSYFIVGFGMFCTRTFVRFGRTQKLRFDSSECRGP